MAVSDLIEWPLGDLRHSLAATKTRYGKMLKDHIEVKPEPAAMGVEENARLRIVDVRMYLQWIEVIRYVEAAD